MAIAQNFIKGQKFHVTLSIGAPPAEAGVVEGVDAGSLDEGAGSLDIVVQVRNRNGVDRCAVT